jgi:uncharacterized SAM-binding protein YcdF (DUF218 family)
MFLFKKIVAPFFFPLPLTMIIILLGLVFLWFTYRQRTGKSLVSLGAFLLLVFSLSPVANFLVGFLEHQYKPYDVATKPVAGDQKIRFIVVLGGGHSSDDRLPANDRLGHAALKRLVEGIRIHKARPQSKLVLSGGSPFGKEPHAKVLLKVATLLGVKQTDTILETESKDTKDEARLLKPILGTTPFIMVTSASHMPRAVALFNGLGMHPLPAPTHHSTRDLAISNLMPNDFFPSPGSLAASTSAIYEYLGLVFAKIRNQI